MKSLAWKQILVTFAVSFVLGTIFGRWEFSYQAQCKWKNSEGRQEWILKRLDSKLNLSSEQETQVKTVLEEYAPRMHEVKNRMRPELDQLRSEIRTRITPLLNDEQKQKYAAMEAERQERWKKYHESFKS